jgi:outer membrane protein
MKHFKTLLLVAVFMLGVGGVANAQKIGHIETDKLIQNMPATKKMEAELQKMQKTYKDEISALAKKYQDKLKRYDAEAKAQTPETNAKRQAEVQAEGQRIQQAEQFATKDMQDKYKEKLTPILERAQKAIKDVAAAKGIIYVFDASAGKGLIVFEKGVDIYDAVKAKLGF